jgi:SAM-dependent methyltransferase
MDHAMKAAPRQESASGSVIDLMIRNGALPPMPGLGGEIFAHAEECEIRGLKPFAELNASEMKKLAALTRDCIRCADYSETEGRLTKVVRKELEKLSEEGAPVYFLDAGAGGGAAVVAAGRIKNTLSYGLSLGTSDPELGIPNERWIRGYFEGTLMVRRGTTEGIFNVIQSCCALMHAVNTPMALQNLLNSLNEGGRLFAGSTWEYHRPFYRALRDQGFVIEVKSVYEIFTKGVGKADLSDYYGDPLNLIPLRGGNAMGMAPLKSA